MVNFKWTVALVVVALSATAAHAGTRVSIVGDVNYSNVTVDGSPGAYTKSMGYGGGLLLEFPLTMNLGFEVGGIYMQRKVKTAALGTDTFAGVQVPVQFRLWLGRMLSIGAGGYYYSGLGDIKSVDAAGTSSTSTYAAYGAKAADYGALGTVGLNLPLGGKAALLIEGRYTYGLANVDGIVGGPKIRWGDMQGLVGLRFGMGK